MYCFCFCAINRNFSLVGRNIFALSLNVEDGSSQRFVVKLLRWALNYKIKQKLHKLLGKKSDDFNFGQRRVRQYNRQKFLKYTVKLCKYFIGRRHHGIQGQYITHDIARTRIWLKSFLISSTWKRFRGISLYREETQRIELRGSPSI